MKLIAQLQRKDAGLPVFVVIPGKVVKTWKLARTTVIEGSANGFDFGRRTIKACLALSDRERREASEHIRSAKGKEVPARRAQAFVDKIRK